MTRLSFCKFFPLLIPPRPVVTIPLINSDILVPIPLLQANGHRALVPEAHQHWQRAQTSAVALAPTDPLHESLAEVAQWLKRAEQWAASCQDMEKLVEQGKDAVAAGNFDEAAWYCREAKEMVKGGLGTEALRLEVQKLDEVVSKGEKKSVG